MKRATTVYIDEDLKRRAKEMGFNLSRLLEDKINEVLNKENQADKPVVCAASTSLDTAEVAGSNPAEPMFF